MNIQSMVLTKYCGVYRVITISYSLTMFVDDLHVTPNV
jgi:hypothetical protein